ncbi:MAG: peptide deformylase [Bacteroidia bacterium]
MILPIVAYGDPVLRKIGSNIDITYSGLNQLIDSMWETMYQANGVGLAAPQVGKSINLFIIDTGMFEETDTEKIKQVFINTEMLDENGDKWEFEEGCLSIPHIREKVKRHSNIFIRYQDEHFNTFEKEFTGLTARVIQHEYDHCKGILFVDYLSDLKKRLLKNKLKNISLGGAQVNYKMRLPVMR